MRTIPKRLQNSYFQLFNSRLISKNQYDLEAISHFEALLNASLPTTDYENSIYYFIKEMYYDDRNKFLNFIQNSNLQPFILYTNNTNIINHFKLYFKARPDIGKEYFEGNIKEMEIAFFTIACKN